MSNVVFTLLVLCVFFVRFDSAKNDPLEFRQVKTLQDENLQSGNSEINQIKRQESRPKKQKRSRHKAQLQEETSSDESSQSSNSEINQIKRQENLPKQQKRSHHKAQLQEETSSDESSQSGNSEINQIKRLENRPKKQKRSQHKAQLQVETTRDEKLQSGNSAINQIKKQENLPKQQKRSEHKAQLQEKTSRDESSQSGNSEIIQIKRLENRPNKQKRSQHKAQLQVETTRDENLQSGNSKINQIKRQESRPKKQKRSQHKAQLQVETSTHENLQSGNSEINQIKRQEIRRKNQKSSQHKAQLRSRDKDIQKGSAKRKIKTQQKHRRENTRQSKQSAVKLIQRNTELQIKRSVIRPIQRQAVNGNKQNETESEPENDDLNPFSIKNDMIRILESIESINATTKVIARTDEYNDIVLCKITDRKVNDVNRRWSSFNTYVDYESESDKKIIFIVHGLSAMGFVKVPCLNQEKHLKKLIQLYTAHIDKFDIFLVPLANPDGIWDRTVDNWNKNKSPQEACSGVALDRNFDVAWNRTSTSCSQQYPGPEPFSEKESHAIAKVLHDYSHKIVAYIHVHAGTYSADVFKGDAVLYPKGFTEVSTDDDKYTDIRSEVEEAIKAAGFKTMSVTVNTLHSWYGKVLGTSVDFAASEYGIPYAMEFVMQVYEDDPTAKNSDERVSDNVLTEVWKRVINTVFTNIHRNTQTNNVK